MRVHAHLVNALEVSSGEAGVHASSDPDPVAGWSLSRVEAHEPGDHPGLVRLTVTGVSSGGRTLTLKRLVRHRSR